MIPSIKLNTGNTMPAFGLGTWQLTGNDCDRAVRMALEMGYNHIDTSDDYMNEEIIGKAIGGFDREKIFITSKVDDSKLRRDDLVAACEASLKRLGTDYLDLYLVHRPNPAVPVDETMEGMRIIADRGLIRNAGISNYGRDGFEEVEDASSLPVANDQIKIHPYHFPGDYIEYLQDRKISVTAYSPLDTGQLVDDELLSDIGSNYGKSAAQVSIRWLLDKGLVVIPKATTRDHLRENIEFDWELSDEDASKIDDLARRALRG